MGDVVNIAGTMKIIENNCPGRRSNRFKFRVRRSCNKPKESGVIAFFTIKKNNLLGIKMQIH